MSAPVSPDGLVTAGQRGEAFVMAQFETHTVGSQFIVLPKGLEFTYPDEPEGNDIDRLVAAKLKKLRIAPSGLCDGETFLRRASIDIVGLPPTVEEYRRFMGSSDPNRRAKWVDELLERKKFSAIATLRAAEQLAARTASERSSAEAAIVASARQEKAAAQALDAARTAADKALAGSRSPVDTAIAKARALRVEVDALAAEKKRGDTARGGLASAVRPGS